jgi:uncharacterized protein
MRSVRHTSRWIGALTVLLLAASGVIGAPVGAAPSTDLFISEYVEGAGPDQKALEIYNGTGMTVDISNYKIEVFYFGGGFTGTFQLGPGTLAPGDVWVAAASISIGSADQLIPLDFNGLDAVRLVRTNGQVLDVIGQIGTPGPWGIDPLDTVNSTLRRKGTITDGDLNGADAFDPAIEWTGHPVGTVDGLGSHSVVQDTGSVSAAVTVASSAACLQLSANAVDFGTLALGAENQPAAPDVTVTNCSGSAGTLLASGTDATGPGASWALDDTSQTCTGTPPLATDRYHLLVAPPSLPAVALSTASKTVQTLPAGASTVHTMRISTACPGSSGAGRTMSMQINYTATG